MTLKFRCTNMDVQGANVRARLESVGSSDDGKSDANLAAPLRSSSVQLLLQGSAAAQLQTNKVYELSIQEAAQAAPAPAPAPAAAPARTKKG